jgi:Zn-dependent alcohol dehydrogenase
MSSAATVTIETLILRDPGPGEVEVTLEAVAICHSDISYIEGGWGGPLPSVYGHEAAGRVTAVGAGVTSVAEGQRVIVTLIRSCGTCPSCVTARPVHCVGQPAPAAGAELSRRAGGQQGPEMRRLRREGRGPCQPDRLRGR